MNWKFYWNQVASGAENTISAVQRNDFESAKRSVSHIVATLKINKNDRLLDVCCGNGILTELIADSCHSITGLDQSEVLLNSAIQNSVAQNASYVLGDALRVSDVITSSKFDKIYMQFSLQYFDKKGMGEKLIKEMTALLKPNGLLFIGDIPEASKHYVFYNTLPKLFYYSMSKIRGKNSMGKFWTPKELAQICVKLNLKGTYLKQATFLPYAWYRFDYLIEKI